MIVVLGRWPRSGTSMLMAMLTAGGITPVTDGEDDVSDAYPVGSFQHREVLTGNTVQALAEWPDAPSQRLCVKMFPQQVRLLADLGLYPSKVILVSRPFEEYADSWDAAFPDRSRDHNREHMEQAVDIVRAFLAEADVPVLEVDFHSVIDDPAGEAQRIADFVGGLDAEAMAAVPDPAHRHFGEPAL